MNARRYAAATLLLAGLTACSSTDADDSAEGPTSPSPLTQVTETPHVDATATSAATTGPRKKNAAAERVGRSKPDWLGKHTLKAGKSGYAKPGPTPPELRDRRFTLPDTVKPLAGSGYASNVVAPAPNDVLERSTWTSRCPVSAAGLAWVRVAFHGFDGRRHTGELLVDRTLSGSVVDAFADLWKADFPIEEMRILRLDELTAKPTGDGNDTSAFVCRADVDLSGYSEHAYGTAIDVNPFQNPYQGDGLVVPELATSYLDRDWKRPGMIQPGSAAYDAFVSRGWTWGGAGAATTDYGHFSHPAG